MMRTRYTRLPLELHPEYQPDRDTERWVFRPDDGEPVEFDAATREDAQHIAAERFRGIPGAIFGPLA